MASQSRGLTSGTWPWDKVPQAPPRHPDKCLPIPLGLCSFFKRKQNNKKRNYLKDRVTE